MDLRIRGDARLVALTLIGLLTATGARAELVRVDIARRVDVLGGKSFGAVGPYESLIGTAYFAVDPSNPHDRVIADLDKAPTNGPGYVEFSADIYIIKPKDQARGSGVLLFDIVNRGNKQLLGTFNRAGRSADPKTEAEFGDGYLLKQGYTLVGVGWQFDIAMGKALVGFNAPIATDHGTPIKGWVRMPFISDTLVASVAYLSGYNTPTYLPLDPQSRAYRLTEREGTVAAPRLIPREEWQFARSGNNALVPDPAHIALKGGFKPGFTYEVVYETQNPPVAGLGMAAIRDTASAFKYGANQVVSGKLAYMYGASQTGRLIRQLIHEGFTIDEAGRKAFDAAFVHTGAAGLGSFNERFAQPNELGPFTQTKFPFLYRTTVDPVTGREDGLGARIPAGLEPKLFLVDSSSEYWDRGRVAAMRHSTMDGKQDLEDAPNVRAYLLSGTKHGSGAFPPQDAGGQFKENPNDYRWAQRGLLAALDAWARQGVEPPASKHPRFRDGTLIAHRDLRFPALPGVQQPTFVPGGFRADVPPPYATMPFLVPTVDADGNEIGGIRLPVVAVPVATLTGWQFRSERIGAPGTLIAMAGAHVPFPATKAERERRKDPRLSIAERYASRAEYLHRARQAATALADDRFVLREDVQPLVDEAAAHWDLATGPPPRATSQGAP